MQEQGTQTTSSPNQSHLTSQQREDGRNQLSFGSDRLEHYAQWLLSIPREDVSALQETPEYASFVEAFERLELAHHRATAEDYARHCNRDQELEGYGSEMVILPSECTVSNLKSNSSEEQRFKHRRRNNSFLQHWVVDDVLIRIFEFLHCSNLISVMKTCHRFRQLVYWSAKQRSHDLPLCRFLNHCKTKVSLGGSSNTITSSSNNRRVGPRRAVGDYYIATSSNSNTRSSVGSTASNSSGISRIPTSEDIVAVIKLLRVKEHMLGIAPNHRPIVRVPLLGLKRRVIVSGAGDEEYNGIYFCTGFNGNGFEFTKPRFFRGHRYGRTSIGGLGNRTPLNVLDQDAVLANAVDEDYDEYPEDLIWSNCENESEISQCRLLRCIIAKRFSNEVGYDLRCLFLC